MASNAGDEHPSPPSQLTEKLRAIFCKKNEVSERMGVPIHRVLLRFHKHPELERKFQEQCTEQFLPQVRKIGLAVDVYMLGYFVFTVASAAGGLFSTDPREQPVRDVDWVSYAVRGTCILVSIVLLLPIYVNFAAKWQDCWTHAALWKHLTVFVVALPIAGIIFSNAYKWGPKKTMYHADVSTFSLECMTEYLTILMLF